MSISRFLIYTLFMFIAGCAAKEEVIIKEQPPAPPAQISPGQVREILKEEVKAAGMPPRLIVGEKTVNASGLLPYFYEKRNYNPAWSDDNGPSPQANTFITIIRDANREGLRPADYHLSEIEAVLEEIDRDQAVGQFRHQSVREPLDPRTLAQLDLLLTDAFLLYGSHLLSGRVNPELVDVAWLIDRQEPNLTEVLRTALDLNQIEETLKNLLPQHPGYARLKQALAEYLDISERGGWPVVPEGPKMEKGHRSERVRALRERLIATGELDETSAEDVNLFDDALEEAVRNFQHRHGLDADGIVGPSTLTALNVPVEKRISQIELNMERWRWLPQDLGRRYVLVNIANFELYVIEDNQTVMEMRVVVGKPYWNTPIFSAEMTHLVLNPYWNIPETIFVEETLPKIRKDPQYLSKDKIKVLRSWGARAQEIDPQTIDWPNVAGENFTYRLRQEPGPRNPLGQIKFMLPNRFNVYLHDTPNKGLFKRAERNFSHGCIRIEKPLDLAEYVLYSAPEQSPKKIRAAINRGVTQTVYLPESIPVYLLYFTAWADEDGTVEFRDDIYGRDTVLEEALRGTLLNIM